MRIVIISTSYKATPPVGYGGIERVVHTLVEQLVRDGHDAVLFGAPGSHCSGRTVEVSAYDPSKSPSGVWKASDVISEEPLYETVSEYLKSHSVDVIHDWSFQNLFVLRHPERFPFVISTCVPPGPEYRRPNLVACSNAHAKLFGESTRFVHYGLDLKRWGYNYSKEEHFIHISKIARYKGQHLAIKAARKTGKRLVLAGNIEDRLYYYSIVKPLLWISPTVKYITDR
jgi:glycosyltransferase involved in cell wall biosynthesis